MKKYSDITFKYLKNQKKRTILTILGIILSVALISSIPTMFYSMQKSEIRKAKETTGDFHFAYSDVEPKLFNRLKNNPKVSDISFYADIEKNIIFDKKYKLSITELNTEGFHMLPIHIRKGRIPKNNNEILIEKWALEKMENKPSINDKVTFSVNGENRAYTIVGILENDMGSQYSGETRAFSLSEKMPSNKKINIFLKLKNKISIKNNIEEFKKMQGDGKFSPNDRLLRLLLQSSNSEVNRAIFIVCGVLLGLVIIATIAVIYNAFHISVIERIKQFGILRSIGSTPKQIRKIVFKEATLLSIIGVPIGILSGIFGLKLVLFIVSRGGGFLISSNEVIISPYIIIGSILLGFASVYLSAYLPAKTASKVSPLDALNNRSSIKKEKLKRRKGIISRLLNIEYAMAYKNIRRNRKRFRITVFSIMISVILFIVFSTFTGMVNQVNGKGNEELNMDYKISKIYSEKESYSFTEKDYNRIKNIDGVKTVYKRYNTTYGTAIIPFDKITSSYKEAFDTNLIEDNNNKFNLTFTSIRIYDDEKLNIAKDYIKEGSINKEKLNKENGVILVLNNKMYSKKLDKTMTTDIANLKVGDTLPIDITKLYRGKEYPKNKINLKVNAILERSPFENEYVEGGIRIITTEKLGKKLANTVDKEKYKEDNDIEFEGINLLGFDVQINEKADRDLITKSLRKLEEEDSTNRVADVKASLEEEKRATLQMMVFLYGFIIVIALIGSLNIINTVSTNMILRKREFSTLKAIGMHMGQINKMVILEGLLYGFVGSIYGLIIGLPISYLLYNQLSGLSGFPWTIPWDNISIAMGGSILIGLLSIIIPLRRIKENNIIESIRMEE